MSILDSPQKNLNPAIWNGDKKLYPLVKKEIMDKLTNLIPEKLIKQVWFIGSNTGLQYSDISDIDISVVMRIPVKDRARRLLWHESAKTHNITNDLLSGTRHPINFFAMPDTDINWGNETYGVYLIKDYDTGEEDVRVKDYRIFEDIPDPLQRYGPNFEYAELIERVIDSRVKELKFDIDSYKEFPVREKLREIERDIESLIEIHDEVDYGRKMQYNMGWGVPKTSIKNFLYKYLERQGLLQILEKLEDVKISKE